MRNIKYYYLAIIIPLGILVLLINFKLINSTVFTILLFVYALIYRTYTDGKRLLEKGIITKNQIWKLLVPGTRIEYFKELYIK